MSDILSIGECMVEFARESDGRYGLRYGGDTLNAAVYAVRAGARAAYATALGTDPYSDAIAALCAAEGVGTDGVLRVADRMPGLYVIETDAAGERSFWYWRSASAAKLLFELPETPSVVTAMRGARIVYFSGITLSIYSEAGRAVFHSALAAAREAGARIAFDGNYRPRGWGGDRLEARRVFERFLPLVDIILPTQDDEAALWDDVDAGATLARLKAYGIGEIVIKLGPDGALVAAPEGECLVPVPERVAPVDTTAAGDSFSGAYLAARLGGAKPADAAAAGHRMAAHVIRHRGAIVPRA